MADEPDTIIIGAPEPAEQHSRPAMPTTEPVRDVLSPHEVADRAGFSYHAILRAIRRGDLAGLRARARPLPNRGGRVRALATPPGPSQQARTAAGAAARAPAPTPSHRPVTSGKLCSPPRNRRELSTVDIYKKPNGKWQVRWREGGRRRCAPDVRPQVRRPELHEAGCGAASSSARPRSPMTYRSASSSRPTGGCTRCRTSARRLATLYNRVWALHIAPRLGDYGVRELTPKRLTRFRAELERVRRRHRDRGQGHDDRAVDPLLRRQRGARRVQRRRRRDEAPLRARPRAAHLPAGRGRSDPRTARTCATAPSSPSSRTRGPRPEEVVCRLAWNDVGEHAIRYVDTKRHRTRHTPLLKPLADDLSEWFLASGRPTGTVPVFPAHDGGFWHAGRLAQLAQAHLAGRARAASAGTARTRPRHAPDAPPKTRGRETCDRAT